MFVVKRPCGREYRTFLIFHVISCNHKIKDYINLLVGGTISTYVTTVPSLMLIGLAEVDRNVYILYSDTSDHMIKETDGLVSRSLSTYVTAVPSLMIIGLVEEEIKCFFSGDIK